MSDDLFDVEGPEWEASNARNSRNARCKNVLAYIGLAAGYDNGSKVLEQLCHPDAVLGRFALECLAHIERAYRIPEVAPASS